MNIDSIKKLENEQKKGLENCQAKIEQWEKYEKDYEDLRTNLSTLADKVSYDIMVPLGGLALLPGKLVHTNEIMVLLGENWFAERSCKQACEIVGRRLLQCEDMLKKLHEEEKQFADWMDWTNQIESESKDFVEIIEEYDPEKERMWQDEHKKNVQKYRQSIKKGENLNMEDYFLEMEKQEETYQEDEVETMNEPETQSPAEALELVKKDITHLVTHTTSGPSKASGDNGMSHNRGRRVSWQDETITLVNDESDSSEESDSPLVINFYHSANIEASGDDDDEERVKEEIINSPADIYIHFASWFQKMPKSILKPSAPIHKMHDLETIPSSQLETGRELGVSSSTTTFQPHKALTDLVIEKEGTEILLPPSPQKRPTSRFKAQKQGFRR